MTLNSGNRHVEGQASRGKGQNMCTFPYMGRKNQSLETKEIPVTPVAVAFSNLKFFTLFLGDRQVGGFLL